MSATLIAKDLTAGHGDRLLFTDLDLVVAPGDVVGLVGVNGAGKSTLLRTLAGLQPLRQADHGALEGMGVQVRHAGQHGPGQALAAARVALRLDPAQVAIRVELQDDVLGPAAWQEGRGRQQAGHVAATRP